MKWRHNKRNMHEILLKFFNQKTNMTDTVFYDGPDTIYLPNPQKIIVHDTFRVVCHKKHCEEVKVIKDTTTK